MSPTRYILTSLLAASTAFAHCQLAWPYPLHSALNPATPEALKDYSMTSPLVSDGTYPCKGFINNPASGMDSVVTWDAGATINYTIAGTATHGGGSCQISMSYDSGSTWNVIYSHVGGCLIDGMTEEITIPTDAPSGEALFAWGWFNLQGNREMYHNCAPVTITNGGQGFNDDDYPTPFVANAGTDINDCITIENTAVVFPSPGKNVKYGGSYASTQPTTPAGFTGSNCVGPGATSSSSSSNSTSSSSSNSTSSSSSIASNTSSSTAANAASSAPTTTSVDAASTATATVASSHTTLWSGSASASAGVSVQSSSSGAVSAVAANATPSSSSSAAAATSSSSGKTCKSKRKRAIQSNAEPRHERLVRKPRSALPLDIVEVEERDGKRVAASKATHNISKRDGKRIAASKATHNVKRDGRITNEDEERRAEGRVAANKAAHVEKRRSSLRGLLGLSHS